MAAQKQLVAARQQARVGDTGPAGRRRPVARARVGAARAGSPARRRKSTRMVYLTDCDPAVLRPGQFLDVEIVGARGYDLIARPSGPD